jgi:hypothetical protein
MSVYSISVYLNNDSIISVFNVSVFKQTFSVPSKSTLPNNNRPDKILNIDSISFELNPNLSKLSFTFPKFSTSLTEIFSAFPFTK